MSHTTPDSFGSSAAAHPTKPTPARPIGRSLRRTRKFAISLAAATLATMLGSSDAKAWQNQSHATMADLAYQVMLAAATPVASGGLANADTTAPQGSRERFAHDIRLAIAKLRNVPTGLPEPGDRNCLSSHFLAPPEQTWATNPHWGEVAGDYAQIPAGRVPYPIALEYFEGEVCGVDSGYHPGAYYNGINLATTPYDATWSNGVHRVPRLDFTGTVLGAWAQYPDLKLDELQMWMRPTNMLGFARIRKTIEKWLGRGLGAGEAILVGGACALSCAVSFGASGTCDDCIQAAVDAYKRGRQQARDIVTSLDSLAPGIRCTNNWANPLGYVDSFCRDTHYVGMTHHIAVSQGEGEWDNHGGMLTENAGPFAFPDAVELLAMSLADVFGHTVDYDKSDAPKNYEVRAGRDGHPNSKDRDGDDWEWVTWPHVSMTPLDNLAWYGWDQAKRDTVEGSRTQFLKQLGFVAHALGDATVCHHTANSFGSGHAPIEDRHMKELGRLRYEDDPVAAKKQAHRIFNRALYWRNVITDSRKTTGLATDIPVRDLITAVARETNNVCAAAQLSFGSFPYNPVASSIFALPGASENIYDDATYDDFLRERLEEAVAVQVAFFTSSTEVLP